MKLLSFLLAPALALAGSYSGTVVSLDGTPVAGAVIKVVTDSVTTTANGTWSLARAASIASRSGKTISVTSNLTLENGRPRLSFGGMDITGRTAHKPATGQIPSNLAAARSQAASDTLRVYWKGKRLTVLPVPADTGNVTFKIDTAWKDDAGIPWNPYISYGSLLDARDGQTYRTVTIGSQTWMAENLIYSGAHGDIGICYADNPMNCSTLGRLYSSAEALGSYTDSKSASGSDGTQQGLCPDGWHFPDSLEWSILITISGGHYEAGHSLKSSTGWLPSQEYQVDVNGSDSLGFRALPSGRRDSVEFISFGTMGVWWSRSPTEGGTAQITYVNNLFHHTYQEDSIPSGTAVSLRCLKD